jgi:hypothetical protein
MAFGPTTLSDFGGGVSDLFAASGDKAKQQYDYAEASNYELAAGLADQNEKFTETSTAIKEAQQQRELTMNLGGQQADTAGAGFAASGSSLDILRDSLAGSADPCRARSAGIDHRGRISATGAEL